jgi:hypothetical protein
VARAMGYVSVLLTLKAAGNVATSVVSKLVEAYSALLALSLLLTAGKKCMVLVASTMIASSAVDMVWAGQHNAAFCGCRWCHCGTVCPDIVVTVDAM